MGNLSFKELRVAISKSCTAVQTEDISDRYAFTLDAIKLENILKQKKSPLHVMAFNKVLESRVPSVKDVQLITEYMRLPEEIDNTFNGKVQVCEFMIFCKQNIQGPVEINNEAGEIISDKDLFNFCNNAEELNEEIIYGIIKNLPVYKILITREFDYNSDMFEYKIYIRSNYEMVTYYKALTDQRSVTAVEPKDEQ
jgi:hypothetical protein